MRWPKFYWAVYGLIKNDVWEILSLKRWSTWYMDWWYGLPSWHIEWKETFFKALQREIKEELNIDIKESDVELVHICHRISKPYRKYVDVYFNINNYTWVLSNNEPDKHSEMKFIAWKTQDKLIPYLQEIFNDIESWNNFSEIFNT